jgi:Abnormal spindle-like microcephaly-assoc'd, ASPM-SPD-2-Hydin
LLTTDRTPIVFLAFLFLLAIPSTIFAQANVNEGLETAFIYVNGNTGSDNNSGTKSDPLKTVGAAVAMAVSNNHKGVGSRVVISPGTYRESLSLGHGNESTNLPMTFEAATNGTVFVSGADVWTDWSVYSDNAKIYTQHWPYQWGMCPDSPVAPTQQDIILRREMLVVNGEPLTEVLSLTAMRPGTFFPDEANATIYVWPPTGTNLATATVEVAARPSLFTDYGQPYVVLRGLTFQYANTCRQSAAVDINNGTNVLIDSDAFLWNNGIGLSFTGPQNFTVQSTTASHNGQMGFFTSQVKHGAWTSDTASYNNWRGAQGAYYSYDTGGGKFMFDHDGTFQNFTALFNQTHPIHFDTDNADFTVNSLIAVGNASSFLIEKSEGPATISDSYFCANTPFGQNYEGGITILNSTSLTYTGNTLFGNGTNQINLTGVEGGISVTNWETGQIYQLVTEHLTLQKNIVAGSSTAQVFDSFLGGSDWNQLVSTLTSQNNTWWAGTNAMAFTVPSPKYSKINFSDWQALTGQDTSSKWYSATSPAACNVQAADPDYLFLTNTIDAVTASPAGQAVYNLATVALGGMTGTVNLSVDALSAIAGATATFTPPSVTTNATSTLMVTVKSTTPPGTYPITIVANNGSVTHTITVSLIVPQTAVRLSTMNLSFAGQPVGTTSKAQAVTLKNSSSLPLVVTGMSVSRNFAQTNNCGTVVNAGASCSINVTYSPKTVGSLAGTLQIDDADPTSPQTLALSGTGLPAPDAKVSLTFLGFGMHQVGTSATKSFTLSNAGGAELTITSLTVSGTDHTMFSQTNNCGGKVAAGASCTVDVTFKPSTKGTQAATLSINDNDSTSPQTVELRGGAQ